ncbi:sulfite exporter TauE/SafE family protein [Pleurocapsa sp. PCC 7319]|uniref:sulfite exporter TauE/SafE family protein n=1 Tax=Pleurocapsa sp. PCC 7319 TaxID=118161 RepID=UPI00034A943E|nr:sulfite exporter TauE/SafE family protein [Pleurocapsa sp. PCC 7319]
MSVLKFKFKKLDLLVPLFVWSFWLLLMVARNQWHLFVDNWFMSVTMAVGSFIAGSTSEGGGAVAFPVMTLMFDIEPAVARDFSLMIQSVGMTSATIAIFVNRIAIEPRALLFSSLGGALGIMFSLEYIAPLLPPVVTKLFFVTLWLSFGVALLSMNRDRQRVLNKRISGFQRQDMLVLIAVGLVGGMVSGITGSGLDILTFSLLVLAFRLDEKIATPTSVVLMAVNALVGFGWRVFFSSTPVLPETWSYWWVSVPVVVIGAPLGAKFIANRSNLFVIYLLLTTIILQFGAALLILPLTHNLMLFSAATFLVGFCFFSVMNYSGYQRLLSNRQNVKDIIIRETAVSESHK